MLEAINALYTIKKYQTDKKCHVSDELSPKLSRNINHTEILNRNFHFMIISSGIIAAFICGGVGRVMICGGGGGFVVILETFSWRQNDFFSKFPFWESKSGVTCFMPCWHFSVNLTDPPIVSLFSGLL